MNNSLKKGIGLRFAKTRIFIPNVEIRKVKNKIDEFTLKNKIKIKLRKKGIANFSSGNPDCL